MRKIGQFKLFDSFNINFGSFHKNKVIYHKKIKLENCYASTFNIIGKNLVHLLTIEYIIIAVNIKKRRGKFMHRKHHRGRCNNPICCPPNVLPTRVAPTRVSPTQEVVKTNIINTVVPHVHPIHTTTVNRHVIHNEHFFPRTESVVNQFVRGADRFPMGPGGFGGNAGFCGTGGVGGIGGMNRRRRFGF
mgnify:CR=1 FL=1